MYHQRKSFEFVDENRIKAQLPFLREKMRELVQINMKNQILSTAMERMSSSSTVEKQTFLIKISRKEQVQTDYIRNIQMNIFLKFCL